MLTTSPPPSARRAGSRAWVTRTIPRAFRSNIRAQSATSASSTVAASTAPPALLTSTSTLSTAAASARTESSSVTSHTTAAPPISAASSSIRSWRRAAQTTWNPSPASARAVAAPMPLLAPVTTAVRGMGPPVGIGAAAAMIGSGMDRNLRWLGPSEVWMAFSSSYDGAPAQVSDLRRVAMISLHTSPLDQPGTGDAGGMNVYVLELARRLAARQVEVDVFTRATGSSLAPVVDVSDGIRVHHVAAGPYEGLTKNELPAQLCVFAREVLRAEAYHPPGYYDLVHSHYWLSGQVGALARDRWGVPLVHTMHTMAKVKNAALAAGDTPEPLTRLIGEEQVVAAADMLVANTDVEAKQLVNLYDADPGRVEVVHPGVDLAVFRPRDTRAARAQVGLPL